MSPRRWNYFLAAMLCCTLSAACAENTADTLCMIHKDLSVVNLQRSASSKNRTNPNLTPWDLDYIDDEQNTPKAKKPEMTKDMALRMFIGSCVSLLVILFAFIVCLISVPRDTAQKQMGWIIVSHAVAAFSALLLYQASKETLSHITIAMMRQQYTVGTGMFLFGSIFLVVSIWLFLWRGSPLPLFTVAVIGMYGVSFAAADVQSLASHAVLYGVYKNSGLAYTAELLIALALVIAIVAFATVFREALQSYLMNRSDEPSTWCTCFAPCVAWLFDGLFDSVFTQSWTEWKQQAAASEDQFAAVFIGFLISQAFETLLSRTWIAIPRDVTITWLLTAMIACWTIALLVRAVTRDASGASPGRLSLLGQNIGLMSAAWFLLDALSRLMANIATERFNDATAAAFLTALVLSVVILCAFIAHLAFGFVIFSSPWNDHQITSFQLQVGAMGFIIGTAWARGLITAISFGDDFFHAQQIASAIGAALVCLVVGVFVVSILGCCILPNASGFKQSHEQDFGSASAT